MDLNVVGQSSHLAFIVGNETVFAMYKGQFVTRESFTEIVSTVKGKCKGMGFGLISQFLVFLFVYSVGDTFWIDVEVMPSFFF